MTPALLRGQQGRDTGVVRKCAATRLEEERRGAAVYGLVGSSCEDGALALVYASGNQAKATRSGAM
jgi:hypothetical protein